MNEGGPSPVNQNIIQFGGNQIIEDIIICRCEEVLLSELLTSIENGTKTAKELKLKTRAGMGICQGRTCRPLIEQLISIRTNQPIPELPSLTPSIPARPLTLSELATNRKDFSHENN
ncbi:(2Fe-2S)-binding protein [Ornithinibacillus sp. L9]|uniref:(2Fe-2S)-binding protein n=1 Tax=Ornithinibacillus caprae TaxID=2678566 RepID=A0A6N8FIT4_9BACI|nr:(2Fe-2S)-binding protein [Ornithinibacillus caprae]MUK87679.1 (2Fe-2S)-binding protein [Ornithinibacillus caprae]